MIPTFILTMWLLGIASVALAGAAAYLAHEWYRWSWAWDEALGEPVFAPQFGWNVPTALLASAVLLGLIVIAGGSMLKFVLRLAKRSGDDPRRAAMPPVPERHIRRPDGSELRVKLYGPPDATPLVFSHGWGFDSEEWVYANRELSEHFRVIVWDEPGLGGSTRPRTRDFSMENLARDLDAVLGVAHQPAVLVGHSIGGMIALTFCRLFPESLGTRVAKLVLTHTTYTNPVRTAAGAAFFTLIEKPVLVPLLYLTIVLSPLVRLMNWLSYRNGLAHLANMLSGFAGTESWEQIDLAARAQAKASPGVLARGMLGMMRFDATATLKAIPIPTLVVAADRDTTCKPEASHRMHRDIPNAREVTLSPARHLGFIEHHERFARCVEAFAT